MLVSLCSILLDFFAVQPKPLSCTSRARERVRVRVRSYDYRHITNQLKGPS